MFMLLKGDDVMGIEFSSNSTNYTQFKHTVKKKKKRKATKPDKSLLSIVLIFSTLLITWILGMYSDFKL